MAGLQSLIPQTRKGTLRYQAWGPTHVIFELIKQDAGLTTAALGGCTVLFETMLEQKLWTRLGDM